MARHSRRVASLVAKVGNPEDIERARLERMPDEFIEREMVADAVKCGFDPDIAAADPYAALSWLETVTIAYFETLSPEEQAEMTADGHDPRKRVWPERGKVESS